MDMSWSVCVCLWFPWTTGRPIVAISLELAHYNTKGEGWPVHIYTSWPSGGQELCAFITLQYLGYIQARSHGGRGGAEPPLEKFEPPPSRPRLPALTFYRYWYWGLFPPGILSAPPPTNDTWLRRWVYTHLRAGSDPSWRKGRNRGWWRIVKVPRHPVKWGF